MSKKILIADSDLRFSQELSLELLSNAIATDHASIGREAQGLLIKEKYMALVLNYDLENFSSLEVLHFIKNTDPLIRVFMIFNDQKSLDGTDIDKKKDQLGLSDVFLKISDRSKLVSALSDYGAIKISSDVAKNIKAQASLSTTDTVESNESDFFSVEIDHFVTESLASFDTYIKLNPGRYLLLVRKGEALSHERSQNYIQSGMKYFYYKCSDRIELVKKLTTKLSASMGPRLEKPQMVSNLLCKSMDLLFDEIAVNGPQALELAVAKDIIQKTQDIVKSIPDLNILVDEFFSEREALKQHSLLSCLFTSVICQNVEWLSPKMIEEVCLGAYLQNIGLSRLKFATNELAESATEEEKEIHKNHPVTGYRFLQHFPVSEKVRQIVLQHHESCDGQGYPFGLRTTKIYPPAKIVFIANELSELILKNHISPKEAVTKIVESTNFREKYDHELLRSLLKGFIKKKK